MAAAKKIRKAVVVGGAGFIGSNICNFLASAGVETVAVDDLSFGKAENLSKEVSLKKKDVSFLEEADIAGADAVFHEGGVSSITMCLAQPEKTVHSNIGAFANLARICEKKGARLVYASTSSVYTGLAPPHREDMRLQFKTIYEIAKYATESISRYYPNAIGLRYFSVYGPNERHKGECANLVTQFLWAMKKGESPVIYGDGKQKRDFIHVSDVVCANLLAATADITGFDERVFNAGTGIATDLNALVKEENGALGTGIPAEYVENPLGKNYVSCVQADTALAKKRLGFEYATGLAEGIAHIKGCY
jgi:UDP-glucose 4-epimerase